MRTAIITILSVVLLATVGTIGRIPGTPDQPPPSNHTTSDCQVTTDTAGTPPPGTDAASMADRIRAACERRNQPDSGSLTGYVPRTNTQGDVPARQSCLDMQQLGYLQGQDCNQIPADAIYHHR